MLSSRQIRQQFLDYFAQRHGHVIVPSWPVVPPDDPTLLFTNAGMNQFKPYFLGQARPEHLRVCNSQKCIRAGGKHNDLEDVGRDTYHHTFFEMLGNWSFGDYFKKEAIAWAWDLLVNVWGVDASRLHATYFAGEPRLGLERDEESHQLWRAYLPEERIHAGGMKDNFWEMGDSGPCGPCSEIHIDLTPDRSGGGRINRGDPQVIEVWNLVFIQYNRLPGTADRPGELAPLPARHVDTGMGLERIVRILQGKESNYDTDLFAPIFQAIRQVTGARGYEGRLEDPVDVAYRVIADHIRCLTFAIADGALPSNEGRGYVLRRILRRAVRHGRQTLGVREPFFYRLVPAVVEAMGEAYPELRRDPEGIARVLKEEEEAFSRTLDRGIALFEEAAERARSEGGSIRAEDAFKLYDTFGFPLDLTQVMARERGLGVDVEGFERLMEEQRQRARAASAGGRDLGAELLQLIQKENLPETEFRGYEELVSRGKVVGCYAISGGRLALVSDRTPFYAEAGGQVGDRGWIEGEDGSRFVVEDTQKVGQTIFHLGRIERGSFAAGQAIRLEVEAERRRRIMANHTVTHLLNHKLRAVLGDHVQQKGSLVDEEKTRFDLSHGSAISLEQLAQIELLVNQEIQADRPVFTGYAEQERALRICGLRAVFGEKYPPRVRVVSVGVKLEELLADPGNRRWYEYPIEFCGGTHVQRTGQIGRFVIVSEEAIGKGIRRVVGLTGSVAEEAWKKAEALWQEAQKLKELEGERLSQAVAELNQRLEGQVLPVVWVSRIRQELAEAQKRLKDQEKQRSKAAAEMAVEAARAIAESCDGLVIVAEIPQAGPEALRRAMDVIRKKHPESAVLLGGATGPEKVFFVASVPEKLVGRGLKAGDWVRQTAQVVGGSGGGRPEMAQAGGKDAGRLGEALETAREYAKRYVGG